MNNINNISEPSISYLEWAKMRSSARFNLATSGIENLNLNKNVT